MNNRTAESLQHDQGVESDADAMMRVGQGSLTSDSLKPKDNGGSREQDGQNLEPDVKSQGGPWISMVESGHQDGSRDDEEEGNSTEDTVGGDHSLVADHVAKAIAHAIIAHRLII